MPSKFIHKPWEMETKYQKAINTIIGKDYPMPIVIHEKARKDALLLSKFKKKLISNKMMNYCSNIWINSMFKKVYALPCSHNSFPSLILSEI